MSFIIPYKIAKYSVVCHIINVLKIDKKNKLLLLSADDTGFGWAD